MTEQCPHGHGEMMVPVGDPLEPAEPYCEECGHISGRDCDDGCHYEANEPDGRGALEQTFPCATCKKWMKDIVALIDHECDEIIPAEALSSSERSTLLYIESRIVDSQGTLDPEQMNYEDQGNIKLFAAAGLLDVEQTFDEMANPVTRVAKFTDEAWGLAADCRRLRGRKHVPEVDDS